MIGNLLNSDGRGPENCRPYLKTKNHRGFANSRNNEIVLLSDFQQIWEDVEKKWIIKVMKFKKPLMEKC